jgi:hypothetical protein
MKLEKQILAAVYSMEEHILMFDRINLKLIKPIKMSFSENCDQDFFRIFHLNRYYQGNLMAYLAIYIDELVCIFLDRREFEAQLTTKY